MKSDKWSDNEARHHAAIARRLFAEGHSYPHEGVDTDNCSYCALTQGGDDGPNYAGWARIYIEAGVAIPNRWREEFQKELNSDNRLYGYALRKSILTFGGPEFVSSRVTAVATGGGSPAPVDIKNSNEVAHFPVATVIEVSIIGTAPASAFPALQDVARAVQEELTRRFVGHGGKSAHPRWAEVRPATREELLKFVPRKVHYAPDLDKWVCDTVHVSKRNLTSNKEEVTCRLCRRKMGLIDEVST